MSAIFEIAATSLPDGFVAQSNPATVDEGYLSDGEFPARKYIIIQADAINDDDVLFGPFGHAATGYVLHPGETSPRIPINLTTKIGIIARSGVQGVRWLAI